MVKSDTTRNMDPREFLDFVDEVQKSETINVFDYRKAIEIIKKEKIKNARFGLDGDWRDTNDICLKNGKAVTEQGAYLNSPWGIPTLVDTDTGKEYPCYTVEDKQTYITRLGWNQEEIDEINNNDYQLRLD